MACSRVATLLLATNLVAILVIVATYVYWSSGTLHRLPALHRFHPDNFDSAADCARVCVQGEKPKTCFYELILEPQASLSWRCGDCLRNETACLNGRCIPGDGTRRAVLAVNGQIPGPPIQVCQNDVVVVDVENRLPGQEVALHWHGLRQRGSPYMDGVPMITQCSIHNGNRFRYVFRAVDPGTHFYHAHSVVQQTDGVFGPLTVGLPTDQEPHALLYDADLPQPTLLVSPWAPTTLTYDSSVQDNISRVTSLLINGRGRSQNTEPRLDGGVPLTRVTVRQSARYRLRVVNAAALNCPVLLAVESHELTVIAKDGAAVQSSSRPHILLFPGERYDVVLNTDQPSGRYKVQVKGYNTCDKLYQEAVLEYQETEVAAQIGKSSSDNSNDKTEDNAKKDVRAPFLKTCPDYLSLDCTMGLKSLKTATTPAALQDGEPDVKLFMPFDLNSLSGLYENEHYKFVVEDIPYYPSYLSRRTPQPPIPQMNNLSFQYPPSPILSQIDDVPAEMICSRVDRSFKCVEQKTSGFCECLHIIDVPANEVVEFVLIDQGRGGNVSHTFHLHGNSFFVLGSQTFGRPVDVEEIQAMDARGFLERNLDDPVRVDTVVVPNKGYVILRFFSDNPGYWLFESRSEYDVTGSGFQFLVQVGEYQDLPPVPDMFPTCGTFKGPNFLFN